MPSATRETPRVTLRDLAKVLKISATAVSMALRNHPRVSPATRKRVQKLASARGYVPDPSVRKLMLHLRRSRVVRTQATLCGITDWPEAIPNAYIARLIDGARRRAAGEGYTFDLLRVDPGTESAPSLQRVLRARGVEGIILITRTNTGSWKRLLRWSDFSVVSTSYSIIDPSCHRVVPHHYDNALLAYRALSKRGFRRIGLTHSLSTERRVNGCYSAALAWYQRFGGSELVARCVEETPTIESTWRWIKRDRPDVVIGEWPLGLRERVEREGMRVPRDLSFVQLHDSNEVRSDISHINIHSAEIGRTAVDILAGMVARGEKGLPTTPTVTMVVGEWVEGKTVRARGGPRKRQASRAQSSD